METKQRLLNSILLLYQEIEASENIEFIKENYKQVVTELTKYNFSGIDFLILRGDVDMINQYIKSNIYNNTTLEVLGNIIQHLRHSKINVNDFKYSINASK